MNNEHTHVGNEPSPVSAWSHNTDMATARLSAANAWLQEEIERLRLTDEEREVLLAIEADASYRAMGRTERVVRGLLERLK